MKLRHYQEVLINRTRASIQAGHRAPLLVSPCGSGKTVMFSFFSMKISASGRTVWVLVHRDELIDQVSTTLAGFSVPHSYVASQRLFDPRHKVFVASVFTVSKRLDYLKFKCPPDYIIIDEAHHAISGSTWGKVIAAFPKATVIGVTATPQRLSGEALSDIFDDMLVGPSTGSLIEAGVLCKYRLFAPSTINTVGLRSRGGDFAKTELAIAADKPTITGDALTHYRKLADGKRAIVYTVSIEHGRHVAEQFCKAGYRAACIDGKMNRWIRKGIVDDFRAGRIQQLMSCDLISEGFDLPGIEVGIMLRPTESLTIWIQQTGRVLRMAQGKERAIILDHAGNALRHGWPDAEREWSLEGKKKRKGDAVGGGVSIWRCLQCLALMKQGVTKCEECGATKDTEARKVATTEGELVELDADRARQQRNAELAECHTVEQLSAWAQANTDYKDPLKWARAYHLGRQMKQLGYGRRQPQIGGG